MRMKKIIALMVLVAGIGFGALAQNRSIQFEETKEWKKIVKKAKKEKKLVFVDCYTDWCGPCKMLAANVFTQDAVADYFNQYFVNAKFEMEKDADGVILKDKFGIKAFPTLVFVDPKTEEVVHTLVGAGSAEWLIAGAKAANDPENNMKGMMRRYAAGERDAEFLAAYLKALASAYLKEEQGKVAAEYLNALTDEQLITKENWDLIKDNVSDPLSAPLRSVMANRSKFYGIAGKEVVDQKLENSIKRAAMEIAYWRPEAGPFDEVGSEALKNYLQTLDFYAAPVALAYLYTAECARKGDYKGVLSSMREAFKYNLFRRGEEGRYFQLFIESLGASKDEAIVAEGVKWLDEKCAATDDYFAKANLMNSKARLLTAIGDTLGADKAKVEEEQYAKEGQEKSGGRIQRAIRLN